MFPMVLQFRSLLMSAGSLFVVIVAMAQNHFHELHLHLKTGRVGNSSVNSVSPLPQLVHVFGVFFWVFSSYASPNRTLADGQDCRQYLISFDQTYGWQAFHLMGLTLIREAFSFLLRGIFSYNPSVVRGSLCQQPTRATWLPVLIPKPQTVASIISLEALPNWLFCLCTLGKSARPVLKEFRQGLLMSLWELKMVIKKRFWVWVFFAFCESG